MNQQEIINLCKTAFVDNQVARLLNGTKPYQCTPDKNMPGLAPTDWESVLRMGIIPMCEADGFGILLQQFRRGFCELLQGDVVDIWCAYNVYFYDCYIEAESKTKVQLIDQDMRETLRTALYDHKEQLTICRLWQGSQEEAGLWGDIWFADQALQRRLKKGVLS